MVATRGLHLMKGGIAQQYSKTLLPCPHMGDIWWCNLHWELHGIRNIGFRSISRKRKMSTSKRWTHSKDFFLSGHLVVSPICTWMTWTCPGVFRYPHQGGLHTPDVVALVALVAQNHAAGVVSAPADSAMKIWPPVEPIRVKGGIQNRQRTVSNVFDLPLHSSSITPF